MGKRVLISYSDVLRCIILIRQGEKFKIVNYLDVNLYIDTVYVVAKNRLIKWADEIVAKMVTADGIKEFSHKLKKGGDK